MERATEPTVSEYLYQSRLDAQSFRLLTIHPKTRHHALIHCSLETFDLRNQPAFVALSYTWANAEDMNGEKDATVDTLQEQRSMSIQLDGGSMAVTPNLLDALLQLRDHKFAALLWVDAICINQADLVERSLQVGIMGEIYGNAELVVVWLGKDTRNDAVQMKEIVTRLAELRSEIGGEMLGSRASHRPFDFEDPAILSSYKLHDVSNDVWASFITFLERRWFYRVWAVQEVVLAKEATVLYGAVQFSFYELQQCFIFLSVSTLGRGLAELQSRLGFAKPGTFVIRQPGRSLGQVAILQLLCGGPESIAKLPSEFAVFHARIAGNSEIGHSTAALMTLIQFCMTVFIATDVRDTIYGVLSILDRTAKAFGIPTLAIQADYAKPPEDVFLATTQHIVEETRFLGLLSLVPDLSLRKLTNLPSWVPSFAVRGPNPLFMLDKLEGVLQFDASKCRSSSSKKFVIEGPVLRVSCLELSAISEVSEPWLEIIAGTSFDAFVDLALGCDEVYFTGEPRVEAVWRTLIGNYLSSTYPAPAALGATFRWWITLTIMTHVFMENQQRGTKFEDYVKTLTKIDLLAKSDPQRLIPGIDELLRHCEAMAIDAKAFRRACYAEMQEYQAVAYSSLPYRRLLKTSAGHICLGPQSAAPGDMIFIVSNCQTPLVFRDVEGPSGARNMILMGEAYVHGMMHGEALESEDFVWEEVSLV
jgi:hypothetical protein